MANCNQKYLPANKVLHLIVVFGGLLCGVVSLQYVIVGLIQGIFFDGKCGVGFIE